MATGLYMAGRKKYQRPQALLWADNPGTLVTLNAGTEDEELLFVPDGYEVGQLITPDMEASSSDINQFLILSDDNRESLDFSIDRIEKRERMINGSMRSYHIADKLSLSVSWTMLPSRGFSGAPDFSSFGVGNSSVTSYTTDGGAGGVEILDWYNNHPGSFWVYLAYDNYKAFANSTAQYSQIQKYSQVVEMQFSNFSYSVVKRGGNNFDFWDVSLTLEEV